MPAVWHGDASHSTFCPAFVIRRRLFQPILLGTRFEFGKGNEALRVLFLSLQPSVRLTPATCGSQRWGANGMDCFVDNIWRPTWMASLLCPLTMPDW